MPKPLPDRNATIQTLQEVCFAHPKIYAAWLEGADALRRVDAYSDIDLWLDVEDGFEDDAITSIKTSLQSLGTLELEHHAEHPHPKIRQVFFRLEETSKFLILDLCVQSHSRAEPFLEGEPLKILFDKAEVLITRPLDDVQFKEISRRVEVLKRDFSLRQVWVEKEVARGRFLEALHNYHVYTLEPLVELLRLRHAPRKYAFYLKDIAYDLPGIFVENLEYLYCVTSLRDIAEKQKNAANLFARTLEKLK